MSHRVVVFASVCALTAGGLLGCGPSGSGTATTRSTEPERRATRATEKDRDIQVRTPGANVDVNRNEDGRLKVDVRAKDRGTAR
jgi:hypothetical protein